MEGLWDLETKLPVILLCQQRGPPKRPPAPIPTPKDPAHALTYQDLVPLHRLAPFFHRFHLCCWFAPNAKTPISHTPRITNVRMSERALCLSRGLWREVSVECNASKEWKRPTIQHLTSAVVQTGIFNLSLEVSLTFPWAHTLSSAFCGTRGTEYGCYT
ncbi:hypothetical protein BD779DRAFT_1518819 [Infundibulicybe gibba]|nr:hypothetical protein BD779DRAFT_1518819 [Infundibulicybe gibba]